MTQRLSDYLGTDSIKLAAPGLLRSASGPAADSVRVVHLVLTLNIGGLEKVVYDLVRCADRQKSSARVLCLGEIGDLGPAFDKIGVPIESLDVHGKGVLRGILAVARRLRELRPDVLHTHNPPAHIVGAPAARLSGVPVVVHTRHGEHRLHGWKSLIGQDIALRCTHRIVAVSSAAAEMARCADRVPQRKLEIIRNGVDLERRSRMDRPSDTSSRRAIHVARLVYPTKDQRTLLRAVRIVVDAEPDFNLWIVGDGPDRAELESLCDALQLREHVRFLGHRHDVHELLLQSDLFVLSSVTEGLSISLLEAMAAELPIVATDVGGNPEVVAHGRTGLLVPAQVPEALASAMLELWRDPQRAAKMGVEGRLRVEEHFDLRRVAAKYDGLYQCLLNRTVAS